VLSLEKLTLGIIQSMFFCYYHLFLDLIVIDPNSMNYCFIFSSNGFYRSV